MSLKATFCTFAFGQKDVWSEGSFSLAKVCPCCLLYLGHPNCHCPPPSTSDPDCCRCKTGDGKGREEENTGKECLREKENDRGGGKKRGEMGFEDIRERKAEFKGERQEVRT